MGLTSSAVLREEIFGACSVGAKRHAARSFRHSARRCKGTANEHPPSRNQPMSAPPLAIAQSHRGPGAENAQSQICPAGDTRRRRATVAVCLVAKVTSQLAKTTVGTRNLSANEARTSIIGDTRTDRSLHNGRRTAISRAADAEHRGASTTIAAHRTRRADASAFDTVRARRRKARPNTKTCIYKVGGGGGPPSKVYFHHACSTIAINGPTARAI